MSTIEKNWLIADIEALTESDTQKMAIETMDIKGHSIYFVDFGGYFKYSCLVFMDGKHIRYANQYELHHTGYTREALRELFITTLNENLFTDEELVSPLRDYKEYKRRLDYICNLYPLRRDYISDFFYGPESEREALKKKIKSMRHSSIAFAYFDHADDAFIDHMHSLYNTLGELMIEAEKDPEYMRSAFLYEMYNHEYGINWQADYDVLSCFGNISYAEYNIDNYFKQLNFSPEIKAAYMSARKEYFANASF